MNILLLTSVYPNAVTLKNDASTKVVHYFAKAWKNLGHNVRVIYNAHRYPLIVYKLPEAVKKRISSHLGFELPADSSVRKEAHYFVDGVPVWRLPVRKLIPHKNHRGAVIARQVRKIESLMNEEGFIPDVVIGHWACPQMPIIAQLKDYYKCTTAIVLHGTGYINDKSFHAEKYLPKIDTLGCRSVDESINIQRILNMKYRPFVCCSGMPDEYVANNPFDSTKFLNTKEIHILFVGRLVKYKNVNIILEALSELKNQNFTFDIIGDGEEKKKLEKLSERLGLRDKVHFKGRMEREKVFEAMSKAHCFVMVSSGEVFGLVYLEAMLAGCITVGTKNEGVDGILIDGENGYLCKRNDINDLKKKFHTIFSMSEEEMIVMAGKANKTVCERFKESDVAKYYLNEIDAFVINK